MATEPDDRWLIGKTITAVTRLGLVDYSDEPIIVIEFSDGTSAQFWAGYGGYDGQAEDEYPCYAGVAPGPVTRKDTKVISSTTGLPPRASDSRTGPTPASQVVDPAPKS